MLTSRVFSARRHVALTDAAMKRTEVRSSSSRFILLKRLILLRSIFAVGKYVTRLFGGHISRGKKLRSAGQALPSAAHLKRKTNEIYEHQRRSIGLISDAILSNENNFRVVSATRHFYFTSTGKSLVAADAEKRAFGRVA